MELIENNAEDLLKEIKINEENYVLTFIHCKYENETISLSLNELQTLKYLREIEEYRFPMQKSFRYRKVLENCPYESWGRFIFQEINKRLIPKGLVEIIVENFQDAFSLTNKARNGKYSALLIEKEKIENKK
ncbi:MAG: hypothetical protein AABX16_03190 [Nanoarchaeota archaeon]